MTIGFDAKRIFHNASGLGNYSRDTVRLLSQYYPENNYLLYNPKPGKVNRLELNDNMRLLYPEGYLNKKFSSAWRRGPIIQQLKRDKIDLFHGLSNELPSGIRATSIKSVVTIHDLIFIRHPEWYSLPDRVIHKIKVKSAASAADRIIAISRQTKADLIHFLHVPADKIEVVYQGCHPAFKMQQDQNQLASILKKYHLPNRYLLNVGTIEFRKNLLTIVKSLPHHPLPLVVVGKETDYAQKVKQYIDKNGLANRVFFLSDVTMEELAAIYRAATIFCYLSLFEGFGIPIIEALYSQTPVIASEGGCFTEAGGPDSIYIPSGDEKALGEKINVLLEDPHLYQKMTDSGFEYAQQFNDENIATRIMELYKSVLDKSKNT